MLIFYWGHYKYWLWKERVLQRENSQHQVLCLYFDSWALYQLQTSYSNSGKALVSCSPFPSLCKNKSYFQPGLSHGWLKIGRWCPNLDGDRHRGTFGLTVASLVMESSPSILLTTLFLYRCHIFSIHPDFIQEVIQTCLIAFSKMRLKVVFQIKWNSAEFL